MTMKAFANKRYHKAAPLMLVLLLLAAITGVAAVTTSAPATAETQVTEDDVVEGQKLFAANCATCHGMDAQGQEDIAPSLVGVGAAAVDFQVGTGRMPMQMSGPQARAKKVQFDQDEINQLAAFVASLGAGPSVPTAEQVDGSLGDPANGMQLFRTNCAMCHGSVGGGGALTQGKYAPSLWETTPTHIYEAMLTGPQSMPVFNEANITPEGKRDIIAYLEEQRQPSPGGLKLGAIGPVAEGFWAWVVGIGLIIASTVWVGARSS
jgi:ubiquinol-cytochrome c reductase cytochrome c subunit